MATWTLLRIQKFLRSPPHKKPRKSLPSPRKRSLLLLSLTFMAACPKTSGTTSPSTSWWKPANLFICQLPGRLRSWQNVFSITTRSWQLTTSLSISPLPVNTHTNAQRLPLCPVASLQSHPKEAQLTGRTSCATTLPLVNSSNNKVSQQLIFQGDSFRLFSRCHMLLVHLLHLVHKWVAGFMVQPTLLRLVSLYQRPSYLLISWLLNSRACSQFLVFKVLHRCLHFIQLNNNHPLRTQTLICPTLLAR